MEVDDIAIRGQQLKSNAEKSAGIGEDAESALSETFRFVQLASSSVNGDVAGEGDKR